ncbi:helix-turn-helix transcriptional regulator [Aminobacter ciceronei]|uniref:Prophage regulatory protein n=1 Tax=Aminobacter ciceronei TaxID=150723 RepID=A0ABR6C793_9HYPH|nr:AlpA family phage regulatory protein [Aminobacter ciceronei]MBA8906822.1 prophage regulatory protein [Aminobacter ciceronei]MBA9020601.1 prophage regulatory protein [Aminobacter ciceronei]
MNTNSRDFRLISIKEACRLTSLSRSSIFLKSKAGKFPKPLRLSGDDDGARKAFLLSEVEAWIAEKIAVRDQEAA